MAKAYLGKISALVTANTSDFNSKLNASAKEVRSFASAMQSSLTQAERAASTSLRDIYTESQKVSRALQAVSSQRLSFKGFDTSTFASLGQAVEQFKKIQNAAVQINEPLSAAARTIEKLSASVQLAFEPAMRSSQKSAEYLSAALARGGIVGEKSFERIRLKAEQAAQAADRLAEASAIAGSGPRGTELAFQDPRLRDSLTASADLRRRAQNASAGTLDSGSVGRLVQQLTQLDEVAVRTRAEIESQKVLNVDTSAAERRLRDILETSRRTGAALESALNVEAIAAAEGQFSRRATPVGDLLRLRQEEERRRRDAEIAEAQGRFSRRATPIDAAGDLERQARSRMGGDIPGGGGPLGAQLEVGRQVDNVINRVTAARQQLDTLPDPLRTALIPALQRATDQASTLARQGFGATAAQIRNAANEAERFEQRVARSQRALNFGQQFGGAGRRGLEFGLQAQSLQGYTAQLQVLQRTLSGVSTQARGPALDAFNRLRTAIATAADSGTIDLEQTRRQINGLAQDAVRAAAAAANISPGRLNRQFQRAGDIGRGAFGNIGLGVQQAVFAVEDFFSVTGGLDQRIRAAGNNISQLGFVLGGTNGLIAGVAVTITAQLIAAYIKWQNASVGTEDRLRSLNDALARQKSLVEDLAGAFRAIADEIGRIGFSKPGADAAQFQKQLDDIRKKQREFNQEQAAALDPAVQRERGIIAAREAQLQRAEDPGERIRLGLDINDARNRERQALDRINSRPGISAADAAVTAVNARLAIDEAQLRENASRAGQGAGGAQRRAEVEIEELRRRAEQDRAAAVARVAGLPRGQASQQEANRIRAQRDDLNREIQANSGFFGFDESAANAERRRQVVALTETILLLEQDVATAAANNLEIEVSKSAIAAAKQIGLAQGKVADAIEAGVPGAVGLQTQLDGLTERLQEAQSELAGAQQRARESGSGGDLQAAQKAQEEVRKIQDAINARDREVKAVDAARRSVELFASAFDRVRQEAESNFQSAQAAADQARGDDLERLIPPQFQSRERARAEFDLKTQRALRDEVLRQTALAEERARQDEGIRRREGRIAEIDSQLNGEGVLNQGQRNDLIAERERLRAENDAAVQQAVDNDPAVRQARDNSTFEERRRQAQERGFQARKTPAQRAGEELGRTLRDIQATFGGAAKDFFENGVPAQRRAVEEAQRQTAPAIFNLADEVQNAVLQGPSRAALQATDVSTVQGASELNRLLRGDDSARNQNLVELQKQSASLSELVAIAKANSGNAAGIFD